ncbi:TIGR03503 family protein [Aliidiomarina sp. Khilg15.8]
MRLLTCSLLLAASSASAWANNAETLPNPYKAFSLVEMPSDSQLPLLGDRFRIDDQIDSITLVMFRVPGTDPLVLIRPDGTKLYSARHPDHVEWRTGNDYDQVRITEPMRGPWQVSGALLPESRLMVISDLTFHAEPLPDIVFEGEKLPVQGTFAEAGKPIEQRDFRNVMQVEMRVVSTNDPEQENFGVTPRTLGEFTDNGRGLDARARDGVFTGEVTFNVPTGAYIPSYRAETPLYRRTFEQAPIMVRKLPAHIVVEQGQAEAEQHQLEIVVDEEQIRADDVVIRGQVEYPNGEVQLIEIQTAQGDSLRVAIPNYVYGSFIMTLELFATTLDGREFSANFAEYEFLARQAAPAGPTEEELAAARSEERRAEQQARLEREKEAMREQRLMLVAVVGGNVLLVGGWIGYLIWRRKAVKKRTK